MNLKPLFEMQQKLMDRIEEEHPKKPGEDRFGDKILALLVEIGELANETRCFKFWSNKTPSNRGVILEEYVDGLHFILDLGIEVDLKPNQVFNFICYDNLTEQFTNIYQTTHIFASVRDDVTYSYLLKRYLGLGEMLGFGMLEIEEGYLNKNKVNHDRQDNGY